MIAAVAVAGAIGLLGGGSAAAATSSTPKPRISAKLSGNILLLPGRTIATLTVSYACTTPEVSIEVRIEQYPYVVGNTILAHLPCDGAVHSRVAFVPVSRAYPSGTFAPGAAQLFIGGTNCYDLKVLPAGGCTKIGYFQTVTLTPMLWF